MKFSNSKIKIEISEEELKEIIQKHLVSEYGKNVTIKSVEHLTYNWTEGYGSPNGLSIIAEEI